MRHPKQHVADVRTAITAKPGTPHRYDVEYRRCGAVNIFMFIEPLGGWRRVSVTEHRKRLDWAEQIRILLEEDYPQAQVVVLVMDNLNTHIIGSLYEAFPPAKAREIARRLEIHYTPKHGSWLNIAEIELSVLSRKCLDQRIDSIERLESECHAWYLERNGLQKGVDWQFTTLRMRESNLSDSTHKCNIDRLLGPNFNFHPSSSANLIFSNNDNRSIPF